MNLDFPVTGQALSPDGRFVAFRAAQGEKRSLYLRPLNAPLLKQVNCGIGQIGGERTNARPR